MEYKKSELLKMKKKMLIDIILGFQKHNFPKVKPINKKDDGVYKITLADGTKGMIRGQ